MDIIYKNIKELIPYEKNAKKHDAEQIKRIALSLDRYGWKQPVVIDKDNVIIVGHGRVEGAKKSQKWKNKPVPCVVADDLTEEEIREYRLADNKLNESDWDIELLDVELEDIEFDMSEFGFELPEEEKEIVEDEAPEVNEDAEPICQLGDIWQLGRHRLMCGDSTNAEDVERLMDGAVADLVITDPPYNIAYEGSNGLTIKNDNMPEDDFRRFLTSAFSRMHEVMKPGAAFYIWHAETEGLAFRQCCNAALGKVRQMLIWNKNAFTMGRQDYQWKHEPCIYGWTDGAQHYFKDDRTQATVIEDKRIDINKLKKDEMRELLRDIFSDKVSTTVIDENKPAKNGDHPTMKPLKLLARLVKNSSQQGEIVLDTFGGSGSTLIACEQLNRQCFMMELDPLYCDVIIDRWENFTGEKAVKL